MIKFIYGNPGTGKTEEIFKMLEKDAESKQKAILIVPEQMTVSVERELLLRLPASAQLYVEVLNYTRLANKLFREHGGVAYNSATRGIQKLLMWRAIMIATPLLSEYCRSGDDDIALADSFLATYNEVTAAGVSFEDLEKLAVSGGSTTIARKIKDIVTISSIYSSLLSSSYSDTNGELARLCELLKNKNCLKGTNVYFDGFSSITGIEHAITKQIFSQADNCTITLSLPSHTYNGLDTVSIKRFSDKLRYNCASLGLKHETINLRENRRTDSSLLSYLSSNLWEMTTPSFSSESSIIDDSISLFRAADIYDECEYAAVLVRELAEQDYRYNEIALIARDAEKYKGIIEPALENLEIPYFISEKTDSSLCPIAKLILSALRITIWGWQRNDVISHLKTGLCGIPAREADIFEEYTSKWNISGSRFTSPEPWNMNPDGYTTQKTERGEKTLLIANSVKNIFISKLINFSSELKSSTNCKELCCAIIRYLEEINVKEALKSLAEKYLLHGKNRQAEECLRMYDVVIDALDCVCDAFKGDDKLDLVKFYIAIKTALEEADLGSIPTSMDEVTIGSANMLRPGNIKCAILLGVCDGEFPSNVQDSGLLNDSDREFLLEHNIKLSGDQEMRASDELYYFRRAASYPSEKLIIFSRANSEPSIAFTRVKKLFGEIKITETASETIPRFKSAKVISEYLHLYSGTDLGEALKRLAAETCDCAQLPLITDIYPVTAENDSVTSDTINSHIGNELRLSQSKIEEFVKCKFAYACKYYLKLSENKRITFAYNNIGTLVHTVLEKFLYHVYVNNKGDLPDTVEKTRIIDQIISTYIEEMFSGKDKSSARLNHLIERLKKLSTLMIDDLLAELSDSNFIPTYFELPIGNAKVPSINIQLKDGKRISINGIVDRVDVFEKDDISYIRVIDYKTGNKTFSLADIEEGTNLQLLIYIFSLTKPGVSHLFNNESAQPAGITYISANSSKIKSQRVNDSIETISAATNEIKRSGLILDDDDVINAVSNSHNNRFLMTSARKSSLVSRKSLDMIYRQVCDVLKSIGDEILMGNANAAPKNGADSCKYCPYSGVCKISKKDQN